MSIDVTEVAYHEAGHTVIAILSGFQVQEVSIGRNESEDRWDGQTKRPKGSYRLTTKFDMVNKSMAHEFDGLKKELSIDCAGFLAQAKHHASLVCGTAHFSLNNDIGQLLTWMKEEKPESQTNLEVRFTSDNSGEDFLVSVHPRWFGGHDRGVFLHGVRELMPLGSDADEELGKIIQSIMDILDSSQHWDKVSRIAEALIAKCNTSASLDEEGIHQALKA